MTHPTPGRPIAAPKWQPVVEQLVAILGSMTDNEVVTERQLSDAIGERVTSRFWPLRRARKELEKNGTWHRHIPGAGLKRLSSQAVNTCNGPASLRNGRRALARSLVRNRCVNLRDLTPSQQQTQLAREMVLTAAIRATHGNAIAGHAQRLEQESLVEQHRKMLALQYSSS